MTRLLETFRLTVPGTDHALQLDGEHLVEANQRVEANQGVDAEHAFAKDRHGIWDLTLPAVRSDLDRFAADYAAVREAEGRAMDPDAIRRLPDVDASHPLANMWAQRRQSWLRLVERLPSPGPHGTALDIGAGCGWLAARLADRGWHCAAVDVTVEGGDGLAAALHHNHELLLARTDMATLPFANDSVDLAVFNASLHYAASVAGAITEARRVTRPGGMVAIVDSPIFKDAAAGAAMVAEFADSARQLGVDSAEHRGPGFVLWNDVNDHGFERHDSTSPLAQSFHRWRGARRAGREVAERPLLTLTVTATGAHS